jgi:hypothetical protein
MNQNTVNAWLNTISNCAPIPRVAEEEKLEILNQVFNTWLLPLGIVAVQFRGYTPGFNDGDPCTHSPTWSPCYSGHVFEADFLEQDRDVKDVFGCTQEQLANHPASIANFHTWLNQNPWLSELDTNDAKALVAFVQSHKLNVSTWVLDRYSWLPRNFIDAFTPDFKAKYIINKKPYPKAMSERPEIKTELLSRFIIPRHEIVVDRILSNLDDFWQFNYVTDYEINIVHDPIKGAVMTYDSWNPEY